MKTVRVQRVERELNHIVARYIQQSIAEPIPAMVTVTAVDVAGDLRKAQVYFRLVGDASDSKFSEGIIENHKRSIQSRVARDLKLKFCPVLTFRYGHAPQLDDVDRLLADLNKGRSAWD